MHFLNYKTTQELLYEFKNRLITISKSDSSIKGILSGFNKLDTITNGFKPADLILVSGAEGMGKTSFTVSLIRKMAFENKYPTVFFSLQLTSAQVMNAIVSQQTKIPAGKFRNNNLNPEETELVFQKTQEYENIPLYAYDYPFLTVSDIEEILECNPPDFTEIIIIDSLQLMAKNKKDQATKVLNKRELTKITFKLKKLAVKFNITILLIADINLISKKQDMRPLLSDIRKYAPIDTFADLVLLLYRPEYYKIEEWDDEEQTSTNGEGEIIIAKNNNGILDNIRVKFDGSLGMFDNLSS